LGAGFVILAAFNTFRHFVTPSSRKVFLKSSLEGAGANATKGVVICNSASSIIIFNYFKIIFIFVKVIFSLGIIENL
jgi:hypothetical protein